MVESAFCWPCTERGRGGGGVGGCLHGLGDAGLVGMGCLAQTLVIMSWVNTSMMLIYRC